MLARIELLDSRIDLLLHERERSEREIMELHGRKLRAVHGKPPVQNDSKHPEQDHWELHWNKLKLSTEERRQITERAIAIHQKTLQEMDTLTEAALKELANLESSIQRRWDRYTLWISLMALGMSVYATFFK
jgi:hypothetical protein